MTDEGVVLLIGSGVQRYREYLLAGAARGRRIWLIDAAESTWQKPYVAGTTVVPLLNPARLTPNKDALIEAALAIAKRERVVGVFSYDEVLIVTTAHIADQLGLPGSTIDGVENCRNKARNRAVLTEAGLPQPRFQMVRTLAEAQAAAEATGYPLVLKPQGMGASIGVIRVDGPAELADAFAMSLKSSYGGNPTYEGGVLVEEMLVGPEISIDGAVFDGEYIPLFLARKSTGLPPYFEEVGHVVDPHDPLLADREFLDVLARAHKAAKFQYGMTHTEVMLTKRGPAIVEINGRLGGDLIPYLGQLATGIDPGAVAADVASGIRPTVAPSLDRVVGIRFAYPPQDCRVVATSVPEPGSLPGLLESAAMVPAGRELRLPPNGYLGRYAYAIATADSPAECAARLDAAIAQAHLEFEAPQADPGELFTR
jgi:biotin carboxylase